MGSARAGQEDKDALLAEAEAREIETQRVLRERKRRALAAQIAALEVELEWEENESRRLAEQQELERQSAARGRAAIAKSRSLNNAGGPEGNETKVSNPGGAA